MVFPWSSVRLTSSSIRVNPIIRIWWNINRRFIIIRSPFVASAYWAIHQISHRISQRSSQSKTWATIMNHNDYEFIVPVHSSCSRCKPVAYHCSCRREWTRSSELKDRKSINTLIKWIDPSTAWSNNRWLRKFVRTIASLIANRNLFETPQKKWLCIAKFARLVVNNLVGCDRRRAPSNYLVDLIEILQESWDTQKLESHLSRSFQKICCFARRFSWMKNDAKISKLNLPNSLLEQSSFAPCKCLWRSAYGFADSDVKL